MDIRQDLVQAIGKATGMYDVESSLDVSLKDLGVSSIDFFKIIMNLSKKIKIDLMTIDPESVSTKMTINSLADYFSDSTAV